jgi:hypothetical protein
MPVKSQYDAEKNVLTLTYLNPFNQDAVQQGMDKIKEHYSPTGDHLYLISDVTDVEMSFSEIMLAMHTASKGDEGYSVTASNQTNVVVGTDALVQMAVEALKQDQYGSVNIKVFASIDEANAYIDEMRQG